MKQSITISALSVICLLLMFAYFTKEQNVFIYEYYEIHLDEELLDMEGFGRKDPQNYFLIEDMSTGCFYRIFDCNTGKIDIFTFLKTCPNSNTPEVVNVYLPDVSGVDTSSVHEWLEGDLFYYYKDSETFRDTLIKLGNPRTTDLYSSENVET